MMGRGWLEDSQRAQGHRDSCRSFTEHTAPGVTCTSVLQERERAVTGAWRREVGVGKLEDTSASAGSAQDLLPRQGLACIFQVMD